MKIFLALSVLLIAPNARAFAPAPTRSLSPPQSKIISILYSTAKEVMSDMDIMCMANAADLCSHYDQCDTEEREALINRFEEQSDVLVERLATLQSLTKHLKTGDHLEVTDEEISTLKSVFVTSLGSVNADIEYLDEMEVRKLQNEIHTAVKDEDKLVPLDTLLYIGMFEFENTANRAHLP